jgi:4a-hydroxytetrahydrobiopterin dehydratase
MVDDRSPLTSRRCKPCRPGTPALASEAIQRLLGQLDGWQAVDAHHLVKTYEFADFQTALEFVNRVGAIAELEGHHPDIFLSWGKVKLEVFTHSIDGLSESDFVLAAKADAVRVP